MPDWLLNSLKTGFYLKDLAIIKECYKQWNEIMEARRNG